MVFFGWGDLGEELLYDLLYERFGGIRFRRIPLKSNVDYLADRPERLDKWLAHMMPEFSRTRLCKWIEQGGVTVDGRVRKPGFQLELGMSVVVETPTPPHVHDLTPVEIPLEVAYEDEFLLVVNKPRGLATHPAASLKAPSLVNALLARNITLSHTAGLFRPGIVHRLDKDTTGLMVVAKDDRTHVRLARQIESKTAERRYFAVVSGEIEQERFDVDAPIARNKHNRLLMAIDPNGKSALTHVKRIARTARGTLVGAKLETGRTHQIRVHLQAVGHPVLGDRTYGPKDQGVGPMQLHASYLAFDHPESGKRIEIYAGPDKDFEGYQFATQKSIQTF